MSREFETEIEYGVEDKNEYHFETYMKNPIVVLGYDLNRIIGATKNIKEKKFVEGKFAETDNIEQIIKIYEKYDMNLRPYAIEKEDYKEVQALSFNIKTDD